MDEHRTVLGTLHHRLEKGLIDKDSGREICRRYLQNLPCYFPGGTDQNDGNDDDEEEREESAKKKKCRYFHPDPRPACEQWTLYGTCKRDNGKKCWYAHESLKTSRAFTIAFHTSTVFGLRLLERCAEIYGAENVTSAARERQESVSGCVVCVKCPEEEENEDDSGKETNEVKVIKLIEKMQKNEPHGFSMCSRIYARDERANEDQAVEFHGDGVEWRTIFEKVKERWCSNSNSSISRNNNNQEDEKQKEIRTVRIRCFPKEMEVEAYRTLDALIEEASGEGTAYGLTGPGKGVSARECDVALDAVLIRGRLHVSTWKITKRLDQWINQALNDAESRRKDIRPLCRAFFKMEEAILRFRLSEFITSASMVVDVGCAPGGWIQALGDEMKRNTNKTGDDSGIIFAVDPARLGFKPPKTVEPPTNLIHLQKKIEESIDDIREKLDGKKLSLVACDGNSSPLSVYRWVEPLLSMVDETKGALVLTMKNFVAGKRAFYEASEELAQKLKSEHQFEETHLVPLFSNSTEEMTLVAFRKKR